MSYSIETDRARTVLRLALLTAVLGFASPSAAQSPTREGTAQALFDEGTDLFQRGVYDRACQKFEASNQLDPKGGTLLNLALCREKQGRTASAWTAFSEAKNRSLQEGRTERVAFADKKMAELRPVLPRLRVVVLESFRPLVITIDGDPLPPAAWGTAISTDPGEHEIVASAPAHRSTTLKVRTPPATESTATIPTLTAAAASPAASRGDTSVEKPARGSSSSRWLGWSALGVGVASLAVGSVFGLQTFAKRRDAERLCADARCNEGRQLNDQARGTAWVANIGVGVGVVALVAGFYLLLRPDGAPAD